MQASTETQEICTQILIETGFSEKAVRFFENRNSSLFYPYLLAFLSKNIPDMAGDIVTELLEVCIKQRNKEYSVMRNESLYLINFTGYQFHVPCLVPFSCPTGKIREDKSGNALKFLANRLKRNVKNVYDTKKITLHKMLVADVVEADHLHKRKNYKFISTEKGLVVLQEGNEIEPSQPLLQSFMTRLSKKSSPNRSSCDCGERSSSNTNEETKRKNTNRSSNSCSSVAEATPENNQGDADGTTCSTGGDISGSSYSQGGNECAKDTFQAQDGNEGEIKEFTQLAGTTNKTSTGVKPLEQSLPYPESQWTATGTNSAQIPMTDLLRKQEKASRQNLEGDILRVNPKIVERFRKRLATRKLRLVSSIKNLQNPYTPKGSGGKGEISLKVSKEKKELVDSLLQLTNQLRNSSVTESNTGKINKREFVKRLITSPHRLATTRQGLEEKSEKIYFLVDNSGSIRQFAYFISDVVASAVSVSDKIELWYSPNALSPIAQHNSRDMGYSASSAIEDTSKLKAFLEIVPKGSRIIWWGDAEFGGNYQWAFVPTLYKKVLEGYDCTFMFPTTGIENYFYVRELKKAGLKILTGVNSAKGLRNAIKKLQK